MTTSYCWNELSPDATLMIFSYLSPKDLCLVARVCHQWRQLSEENYVWRAKIHEFRLHSEVAAAPNLPLKTIFKRFYLEFGNYLPVYNRIKKVFDTFTEWINVNYNKAKNVINKGTTEEEINEVEQKIGHKLPLDLRLWYRLMNGENWSLLVTTNDYDYCGIFGGYSFYDHHVSLHMLPLATMAAFYEIIQKNNRGTWIEGCVPVVLDTWRQKGYFLVLDPSKGGGTLAGFKKGNYVVTAMNWNSCFPLAESWTAFIEDYVHNLITNNYIVIQDEIHLFPVRDLRAEITDGVIIKSSPLFISEMSEPNKRYLWAYRIFMSMDPNESELRCCQLITRHWRIVDGNGKVEEVQGPGVIGKFPKVLLF